jgi:AcrR family transcriptional regulator
VSATRLSAQARRLQILQVATRLFSQHGYLGTTTQAIASEAGVTEPIIYRHFENKANLYLEVLAHALDDLLDQWHAIRASEPPERWLPAMGAAYRRALREGSWPAALHLDALANARVGNVRKTTRHYYRRVHEFVAATIAEAQERGALPAQLDPQLEAWRFVALGLLMSADAVANLLPAEVADQLALGP